MYKLVVFAFFFIVNFGALALGSFLMGSSPIENDWYIQLNKAPWTPPGWVFGLAWSSIMILFTLFLTFQDEDKIRSKRFISLFTLQFITNVIWNPIFFYFHWTLVGLIIIFLLFLSLVFLMLYFKPINWRSTLLFPYLIWLTIAFSLNAYSWWMN
jgi:benzodiazapine receptor